MLKKRFREIIITDQIAWILKEKCLMALLKLNLTSNTIGLIGSYNSVNKLGKNQENLRPKILFNSPFVILAILHENMNF